MPQKKDKSIKIGNLWNFKDKKYCRDKECIFLDFFHEQMNIGKKPWKSQF